MKPLISVITIFALGVFGWTLVHALWYAPDNEVNAPALAAEAPGNTVPKEHYPSWLIIPSLHISAAVQYVGIKADNSMGTPSNFTDVAWYKYGPVPGQVGSAVIDGHVDNGLKLDGVFKHLGDIKIGDDVYVQRKDGSKLHFVVSDIESYPYRSVPTSSVFGATDKTRLDLITCEGHWVKADKTYDQRLVVYTVYKNTIPASS